MSGNFSVMGEPEKCVEAMRRFLPECEINMRKIKRDVGGKSGVCRKSDPSVPSETIEIIETEMLEDKSETKTIKVIN